VLNMMNVGDNIPLKPIAGLASLEATAVLSVIGLINEAPARGDLKGLVTMNGQSSKVTVSGSLLGEVAAQIGGSLVGLFTPSTVDLYKVPQGVYVVVNGFFAICVKPQAPKAIAVLEEMSPQSLLVMLTSSDVAYGVPAGEEFHNGRRVKHYIIDGPTFLAAARNSADRRLRSFAEGLWSAGDADLYVDMAEGYPVAFRGSYSGAFEPLKFKGNFELQIELTGINKGTLVNLPPSCDDPITM
jgi:hypothetical protein